MEALQQSENRFEGFFENASVGMVMAGLDGRFMQVNDAICTMLGYSEQELLTRTFQSITHPDDLEPDLASVSRLLAGEIDSFQMEKRYLGKRGNTVWISLNASVVRDPAENPVYFIGQIEEITERKEAQEELSKQRDFLRNTIEALNHPFYVINAEDYSVEMANSAADFGPLSGCRPCYALTHGRSEPCRGEDHPCPVVAVKGEGKPFVVEHVHTDRNGHRRDVEVHAHPVFDNEGKVARVIEYSLDITERKRAEEALRQAHSELEIRVAERTEDLVTEIAERKQAETQLLVYQGQLRSLASELTLIEERERRHIAVDLHDRVGQTLAVVQMKLDALTSSPLGAGQREALDEVSSLIRQTGEDIRSLTFELSPPVLYELGLEAAIEWLAEQFEAQHGLRIEVIDDRQPKPLDEDVRTLIFRAVRELLVNVVKHARADTARVSLLREGDSIRAEVADDGIGFDASQPVTPNHLTGGFGLFSVRERLDSIGGSFEIDLVSDHGTRVLLVAPLSRDGETASEYVI